MPLVNEVVIGLKDKDKFNASEPKDDGQFATYVTNPTLPALLEVAVRRRRRQGADQLPAHRPRRRVPDRRRAGVNQPANVVRLRDVRLNTSIAPTPGAAQNRLGVLGGDNAGFPNGRRPGDDVVDIELRVAMGGLCTVPGVNTAVGCKASDAPAGSLKYTDGAYISSTFFANEFPYLRAALKGSPNDDNAIKSVKQP